jgi:hypothetical protein
VKPCPRCSSTVIGQIIGVASIGNVPHHVQFNCSCGTTRGIAWAAATEGQRIEAGLVQMSRDSRSEMTCR